ncbi:M23 family metallopeptidase [Synechococcus sp. CS-1328]|uniref:M23 family metallopeptidase n=1 Tax=Synechococcus sp. CS-1328 TaxID=2847976 RepID=UPI00223BF5FF|nr:M23 family metallopeptidase [Synechococcus sp. CS-1328]MCT0226237.1 M23 family metallopeptidase [Synechococcus sp. CS-1328]
MASACTLALLFALLVATPAWAADDELLQQAIPTRPEIIPTRLTVADVLPTAGPSVELAARDDLAARHNPVAPGTDPIPPLLDPLAGATQQTDPWGWRFSEARSAWRMHTGLDLAAPRGTTVRASLAGRVVLVEEVGGYGLTVVLAHTDRLETLYAHLDTTPLQPGDAVQAGQPIGRVGMSGQATGPHLHFELRRRGGVGVEAIDPTPHLTRLIPPPVLPPLPESAPGRLASLTEPSVAAP